MPRIVEPDGDLDAPIVVLGEAPGTHEQSSGIPFVGPSGKLLFNDILARANIARHQTLALNVYWEKPPYNDFDRLDEPWRYADQTAEIISAHPRKLIFAVGEKALWFLTGESGITKWRGSIIKGAIGGLNHYFDSTIIPLIHPAAILRQYSWLVLCRHDARRGAQLIKDPTLSHHDLEIVQYARIKREFEDSTLETFHYFLDILQSYKDEPCIAFDIETYRETITCLGFAKSDRHSIVIPLTGEFSNSQSATLLVAARDILLGTSLKVGQNLDYDTQYLARCFGIGVRNVWMDTMVAHSVMHPEMSHSLDTLTSLYTLHPFYKEMRKEATEGRYSETLWRYNGIDCCITYQVACELFREMVATNTLDFFTRVSMPVTKTLVRMESTGVNIDHELRNARGETLQVEIDGLLAEPSLKGVNPNSPKQVIDHLAALGIKLSTPRGKKKPSTDETALSLLRSKTPSTSKFVTAILDTRERRKIIGTYISAKCDHDGRMHTSYRTSATKTGRLSSSKDVFNGGMNLQNVPVEQRDWFIPTEGKVFWAADASQIEARITAWVSKDRRYCEAFLEGRDIHSENASRLFGIPVTRDTCITNSDKKYRDVGKMSTHAMNYMIGPVNLHRLISADFPELGFSLAQSRSFLNTFQELFPGVIDWWKDVIAHLKKSRVIVNPYGRRRVFLDRSGEKLFKDAVAHIPQSTAADHINLSLIRTERDIESIPGALVLLQTHDEIAGECFPDDLAKVQKIVTGHMETPLPIEWKGHVLKVPAEFHSGESWQACHG
jgi:DNA polymerase-1